MIQSFLPILLAIIGIGLLIFLHELGHYFMARKRGMRVEVFSIGFGRAIYSWHRKGVRWQIGFLPFGGYVKIAGMQKEGDLQPEKIPNGFFGKSPWDRLLVAFSGPFANIVAALVIFSLLWSLGGRESTLALHTQYVGWVDPSSALYQKDFRPGDRIIKYNDHPFENWNDLLYTSALKKQKISISGEKVFRYSNGREEFSGIFSPYQSAQMMEGLRTIGVLSLASYLIYVPEGKEISPFSPMRKTHIEPGDRIVWVNGSLVFSLRQFSSLLNQHTVFFTVQRDGKIFHANVPCFLLSQLHLSTKEKAEIDDWRFEASLKKKLEEIYLLPYLLNSQGVVEGSLMEGYVGLDERNPYSLPLFKKDRILAVNGEKISSRKELLKKIQEFQVMIIVDRTPVPPISWKVADKSFEDFVSIQDVRAIISSIGTEKSLSSSGSLYLLSPTTTTTLKEMAEKGDKNIAEKLQRSRKEIETLRDSVEKQKTLHEWEEEVSKNILGLPLRDRIVEYNPSPWTLFTKSSKEMYQTLVSLIRGQLHPKWLAGPLGMFQVVQKSWSMGIKETLYWFGVISLNLGFINLLPLPVLDGGSILLSLLEMVTRRRLKPKTLDRLIFPFFLLLILAFIFMTYQDILRIFGRFFHW